jgi:hypothetical protein
MNLDEVGSVIEEDDWDGHAPSDRVYWCQEERACRKGRDRDELQDLWREETQRRKRERAPSFYRKGAWL